MRVVFVQKFVPHYRLPFFEQVAKQLNREGIEFVLVYGKPDPFEGSKVKTVFPEWGIKTNTRHFKIKGRYLYWQNAISTIKRGDFVIVEHAAKLLDNYLFFAARQVGYLKMGYFGHGHNFQATTEYKISAVLKRFMLKRIDRWFAYTEISQQSLLAQEVDSKIISVVNNTLEKSINVSFADTEPDPLNFCFIGGMYDLKLLSLLVAACTIVAKAHPSFELHLVGQGPDKQLVDDAAKEHPWLKVHGALYGQDRDRVLANSSAILMPGLVGLVAIDAFHFRRPIITSEAGEHSPEIAYLEDGYNSLMDRGDSQGKVTPETYADTVCKYIDDSQLQHRLRDGCRQSTEKYSIENMADNFCQGILQSK